MTIKIIKFNKSVGPIFMVALLALFSCTEWDGFKRYTESGEIVYPGKIESVEIFSGENRVKITGELSPDPKVSKYRIFWNDFKDSAEFDASHIAKPASFEHIIEVEEGVKTFVFHTYDELGNRSIAVSKIGASYGANYRKKMTNRIISSLFITDTSTVVIWEPIDLSTGAKYTTVEFESYGTMTVFEAPVTQDSTHLKGLIQSGTIRYATVYKPEDDSIDLFLTDYDEHDVVR